ncbi:hypothetical protein [Shouchella shacheensis]|uniref:hypothetical protein n=1 Tax=Shouchella shacheensis TaxID=1649580 RepID=UPI00073FF80D|nr:hypothetical protein [Shouchella shacheensis]
MRAEDIIEFIHASKEEAFSNWGVNAYVPTESGILIRAKTATGEKPVVISVESNRKELLDVEVTKNESEEDRLVLGGAYDVVGEDLCARIERLLVECEYT